MIESAERYLDAFVTPAPPPSPSTSRRCPTCSAPSTHMHERGARPAFRSTRRHPSSLDEILPEVDFVLVMSVNPGFGGQKLLPSSLDRLRRLRTGSATRRLSVRIQVDGGVHRGNVRTVVEAGAEIVIRRLRGVRKR